MSRTHSAGRFLLVAGLLTSAVAFSAGDPPAPPARGSRPLAVVFWEEGFPAVGAPAPDRGVLDSALGRFDAVFRGSGAFGKLLDDHEPALVVLPYGSAFPAEAWGPFLRYLGRGGSFVQLGGSPFAAPVDGRPGARTAPSPNPSLAHRLGFVRAEPAEASRVVTWEVIAAARAGPAPLSLDGFSPRHVPALDVLLSGPASRPDESGSDGPREGVLTPLVVGRSAEGTPRAAPVFRIDRVGGEFAGGRWLFALGDGTLPPSTLSALFASAAEGASVLSVRPAWAAFRPGEAPRTIVRLEGPRPREGEAAPSPVEVELLDPKGRRVSRGEVRLAREGTGWSGLLELPPLGAKAPRGLYTLRAGGASSGFLVQEAADLAGGPLLGAQGSFLARDGRPFAAAGMTFMDPSSQRRLFLEPDPLAWEDEFAAMEKAGVNLVRTGIWTGWKLHAPEAGRPTEGLLRAVEALVATARRHGMPVVLTLFAFLPETWGGGHPYLSPGALEAQRTFAGALASRLAGARDVAWDLINEPSFADPSSLWRTRPAGGTVETEGFARWLEASPLFDPGDDPRARWRMRPDEPISLPAAEDFEDRLLSGGRRPYRALDFRLFAQDAFRGWALDLSRTLAAAGSRGPVTVGTDEGGTGEMPNPLFFGDAVGFTQVHSWWNGADLSWDTLAVRVPGRPALVGETGLMSYERADAAPWLDTASRRRVLSRKLALSLGAGGAGAVAWAWRTNPLMPSANEAGIGLFRADGTARPELDPFRSFARFAARLTLLLSEPRPEEVAVVLPLSRLGPGGELVGEASRRAVRLLEGELRLPSRIVAEGRLATDLAGARLVVVPSPGALTRRGWEALLEAARAGATVLVTGPFDDDPWGRSTGRAKELGLPPGDRVLSPLEPVTLPGGARSALRFRGGLLERARGAAALPAGTAADRGPAETVSTVRTLPLGEGRLVLFPLPIELAEESPVAVALYALVAEAAGVSAPARVVPDDPSLYLRTVSMTDALLLAVDGPPGEPTSVRLRGVGRPIPLARTGDEATLILVRRSDGAVLARSDEP